MSMEEWPDDHLDELFRKSAEEFDVHFNSDDWTDMSRRLDEHDRQTVFDRISRWGGIAALVLLLLGGLGWVMYDEKPMGNHQPAQITVLTPARKSVVQPAETNESANDFAQSDKSKRTAIIRRHVPENQVTGLDNTVRKQQNAERVSIPAGQETTKDTDRQPGWLTNRGKARSVNHPGATTIAVSPVNREHADAGGKRAAQPASEPLARQWAAKPSWKGAEKSAMNERSAPANTTARSGADLPGIVANTHKTSVGDVLGNVPGGQADQIMKAPVAELGTVPNTGMDGKWLPAITSATSLSHVVQRTPIAPEAPLPDVTITASASRAMPKLMRLSVLLFASPDLSGIGLTNFDRPGTNEGLAVQYQITDRWSVNAGAMYSTKRYQTYASEYVWPSYMNMDVWPEEISGVCKMIDIPLNVRYDWLVRPRGNGRAPARWFASAGLTSYFIQHEVYSYEYADPADPKIKYWGWDNQKVGRAGGSFGFSNLNISLGYEHPITNRLSWQVEPFLKVPLKQVGYFKIRLLSTGAFVGLRYRF